MLEASPSIVQELTFLKQQTGHDEAAILAQAIHLGVNLLYRQTIEQAFIDDDLSYDEAVAILGQERIEEIEYAKQALAQDVRQGLAL